jgi:hypothetical protein
MKTSDQIKERGVAIIKQLSGVFSLCVLTGCASMRFTTTLPPSDNRDLSLGDVKVNIAKVSSSLSKFTRDELMTVARQQYPRIFSDAAPAVPVDVTISGTYAQDHDLFLLACLSFFTIPAPRFHYAGDYAVRVRVADEEQGLILDQRIRFKRDDWEWISLYTPLGLIPIPGRSDLARSSYFMDPGPDEQAKQRWLDNASCVEAITQMVRAGDAAKMQAASRWSSRRIELFTVAGQPVWCKRMPVSTGAPAELVPDVIVGEIYLDAPDGKAQPVETVPLAKRWGGSDWRATPQYLSRTRVLSRSTAVIENGKPVRVEIAEVKELPLVEFLEIQAADVGQGMDYVRWRTRILLQAKTSTLPTLLKEHSAQQLQELIIKAEQAVLNCTHEADLAKNRAQQAVEKGSDPAQEREWSLLYNEHLAVLSAILKALKEESASRQR